MAGIRKFKTKQPRQGWADCFLKAASLAFLIYIFVCQISQVEGKSMEPTFKTDDMLIVEKITYCLRDVRRFDVIVFKVPPQGARTTDRTKGKSYDYIKRVIGLPGEKVELQYGNLYINDKPVLQPFVDQEHEDSGIKKDLSNYGPEIVPYGHYVVMGDNRGKSSDSRNNKAWKFVPETCIRGIVRVRFVPLKHFKVFTGESY